MHVDARSIYRLQHDMCTCIDISLYKGIWGSIHRHEPYMGPQTKSLALSQRRLLVPIREAS